MTSTSTSTPTSTSTSGADAASFVSQVVLGEHELLALVRADAAVAIYRARSTVDGGIYTVFLLRLVRPTSGATEIAGAATRASRLAIGQAGVLPVLAARIDRDHTWIVRRGEPGRAVSDALGTAHRFHEVSERLAGPGKALSQLHDTGQLHGALSPLLLVALDERAQLDGTGLSLIAEASAGTRGLREAIAPMFRPPELAGEVPSSVGPWSDVYAFARIALALLRGETDDAPASPVLDDLRLPGPLEKALKAALSASPAARPGDVGALLAALANAGTGWAKEPAAASPEASDAAVVPGAGEATPAGDEPATNDPTASALPPTPVAGVGPETAAEPVASPPIETPVAPPKKRDPLTVLIAVTTAFAALLFLGGVVGAGVWAYRETTAPTPTAAPVVTVPTPIAVPGGPATPSPTPAPSGTVAAAPGFLPRPPGEIPTSGDDADALLPVLADDPIRGDRRAPVTMVVFADLTCPHSLRLLQSLPAIEAAAGADLRTVVKLYPLPDRTSATDAAEAALAVHKKGGNDAFFAFLLVVAKGRGVRGLDPGSLEQAGIRAGAPAGAVTEALRTRAAKTVLETNIVQGRRMAVVATPVVFLNGRRFDGLRAPAELEKEISDEATRARAVLVRGALPDRVYRDRVFSNVTTAEADGSRR
jgi:protein-disulfide isomerase